LKACIDITEIKNMKPEFQVGDYVHVTGDTSPGNNRPEGHGFIEAAKGAEVAPISTVRHKKVHGGFKYRNVLYSVDSYCQSVWPTRLESSGAKGGVYQKDVVSNEHFYSFSPQKKLTLPSPSSNNPPANRLVRRIREKRWHGVGKGWCRKEMIEKGMTDKPKKWSKAKMPRLNELKNTQLLMEVALLEQYLSSNDNRHDDRCKRSGQFKSRTSNDFNPVSKKCLIQHA
jgi:hypothetical protein